MRLNRLNWRDQIVGKDGTPNMAFQNLWQRLLEAVEAVQSAIGAKQPLDDDLTLIAALTTTAFGRGLLTSADAAALRAAAGLGTIATLNYTPGTFTPLLRFNGTSTGMTYSEQSGRYKRVGDLVFVDIRILLSAKGSSTGTATIDGLPFTSAGVPASNGILLGNNFVTVTVPQCRFSPSSTSVDLYDFAGGASVAALTASDFANNTQVFVTGFYSV